MIDTQINISDNGDINATYYKQATLDIINRTIQEYNYNPEKITSNHLIALLRACYHALFEPTNTDWCNHRCNIPYTENNISILYNIYLDICEQYICIPSNYGFYRYTGIKEDTLLKYVTASRLETQQKRANFIQNKLSENPIGIVTLANNDKDTGLLYNRQNMIEKETIKQGLTLNDFVKISDKHSN